MKSKPSLLIDIAKAVVEATGIRKNMEKRRFEDELRRIEEHALYIKQVEGAERSLTNALIPIFVKQIEGISKGLLDLKG